MINMTRAGFNIIFNNRTRESEWVG